MIEAATPTFGFREVRAQRKRIITLTSKADRYFNGLTPLLNATAVNHSRSRKEENGRMAVQDAPYFMQEIRNVVPRSFNLGLSIAGLENMGRDLQAAGYLVTSDSINGKNEDGFTTKEWNELVDLMRTHDMVVHEKIRRREAKAREKEAWSNGEFFPELCRQYREFTEQNYGELIRQGISSIVDLLYQHSLSERTRMYEEIWQRMVALPERVYRKINKKSAGITKGSLADKKVYVALNNAEMQAEGLITVQHETVHMVRSLLGEENNEILPEALIAEPRRYTGVTEIKDLRDEQTDLGIKIANLTPEDEEAKRKFRQALIYTPSDQLTLETAQRLAQKSLI